MVNLMKQKIQFFSIILESTKNFYSLLRPPDNSYNFPDNLLINIIVFF